MNVLALLREAWRLWRSESEAETVAALGLVAVVLVTAWLSQSHVLRELQRNERERLS
jgi:hypothetical protein